MLSSDAEHFYWLSRYAERAENTARLVNVNVELMLDFPGDKSQAWKPVVEITGMDDSFSKKNSSYDENVVINFLTFDKNNPNSILSANLCLIWLLTTIPVSYTHLTLPTTPYV